MMIPDNVTLVVKAPNQQIEDQNIDCRSSWTVKDLKGHLSEVYPSNPRIEEQKIIYSGQLLEDNAILKDILRSYESTIVHTIHLVCTPTRRMTDNQPPRAEASDGLRRRNVEPERAEIRPEMRQNDQNHSVEMQNYLSSFVNNYSRVPPYPNFGHGLPGAHDPASAAHHMMLMQHAYLQYMQQYANLWQATIPQPDTVPTPEAPPQPVPETPPPVQPDEGGEEAPEPRDWLDNVYAASRLGVLLSLIYIYGNAARLLLLMMLIGVVYLYQTGFFRDFWANQNNVPRENGQNAANQPQNAANPPQNAENQPQNAANQPQNAANQPQNAANQPQNAANRPQNPESDQTVEPPVPREDESLLGVTRMIFTTFFTSLIPDLNY